MVQLEVEKWQTSELSVFSGRLSKDDTPRGLGGEFRDTSLKTCIVKGGRHYYCARGEMVLNPLR
jgi:hypothetical protein